MRILLAILNLLLISNLSFAQEEYGIASYYSDAFHGRKTASGELYDKNKLTAAHKELEYGTIIKVTRLDNKSSVRVRINDNGPYIKGRIVELSRKAAERIGIIRDGHAEVKIEVVGKATTGSPDQEAEAPVAASPADLAPVEAPTRPKVDEYSEELVLNEKPAESDGTLQPINIEVGTTTAPKPKKEKPSQSKEAAQEKVATARAAEAKVVKVAREEKVAAPEARPLPQVPKAPLVKGSDYKEYDLYKIQLLRPEKSGFGVQLASMTQYENVLKKVAELQEQWFKNILISVEKGDNNIPIYKIILGPFGDAETAQAYKTQLKKKKKIEGFVIDLAGIKY
ncbi:MAG: septal ring lytic transglycosylase RlpA family protein [Bacteroidota bacterium]